MPSLDLVVVRNGHYDEQEGDALADPNLFGAIPSMGLVEYRAAMPPDDWTDGEFLGPIVDSIGD